jgi:AcrR family transcriptional regulator
MSEQPRRESWRGRLTRERVVEAALELIDRDGVDGFSMRRLGQELGVEAMALYSYVRSKDELLDAVGELLVAGLDRPPVERTDWRGRIRAVVEAWSALQLEHPSAFALIYRFRRFTDTDLAVVEELMDALTVSGLDPPDVAVAYNALVGCLDGMLLAGYLTSYSAREVWEAGQAFADPHRFPRYREVAPHAAQLAGADIFAFGVDLLLDGIEARVTAT